MKFDIKKAPSTPEALDRGREHRKKVEQARQACERMGVAG